MKLFLASQARAVFPKVVKMLPLAATGKEVARITSAGNTEGNPI